MKVKTSELIDGPLDWAVCKAQGIDYVERFCVNGIGLEYEATTPSTDWAQGGPIIEREIAKIERFSDALWEATAFTKNAQDIVQSGPTPLVAAMRCYVASKLGDEVDVPDELV